MTKPALAKSLHKEIDGVIATLTELGLADDQQFTVIREREGLWNVESATATYALALKDRPYAEIYAELVAARNFNIKMLDGALLQLSYAGDENTLHKHRLAYLPSPALEPYQNNPDLYIGELVYAEVVGHQVMPVPIRIDYDPGAARDIVHPVVHATLGQYKHCRLPVTRPASPKEFVELILHGFYSVPDMARVSLVPHVDPEEHTITPGERSGFHVGIGPT